MKTICIIPARGGSKGIPKKNMMIYNGKPLIHWAIKTAKECYWINWIVVSTDDEEIEKYASQMGVRTHRRGKELSGDEVPTLPVLKSLIRQYMACKLQYDNIVCLYPTSPLLSSKTLTTAYVSMKKAKKTSCVGVEELEYKTYWNGNNERIFPQKLVNRQYTTEKIYKETGGIYIYDLNCEIEDPLLYIQDKDEILDIN